MLTQFSTSTYIKSKKQFQKKKISKLTFFHEDYNLAFHQVQQSIKDKETISQIKQK